MVLQANCENGPEVHFPHASAVVSKIGSVRICGFRYGLRASGRCILDCGWFCFST